MPCGLSTSALPGDQVTFRVAHRAGRRVRVKLLDGACEELQGLVEGTPGRRTSGLEARFGAVRSRLCHVRNVIGRAYLSCHSVQVSFRQPGESPLW